LWSVLDKGKVLFGTASAKLWQNSVANSEGAPKLDRRPASLTILCVRLLDCFIATICKSIKDIVQAALLLVSKFCTWMQESASTPKDLIGSYQSYYTMSRVFVAFHVCIASIALESLITCVIAIQGWIKALVCTIGERFLSRL
jgi:hypothetical protein